MKIFFQNFTAYWKKLENRFYAGPSFLYALRRKSVFRKGRKVQGYVSPSLMLGVWGYGLIQLFLPPQGWLFLWSYLAIGFYSSIMTRSPAHFLFLAMSIAAGLNIFYRIFFSPRLHIRRKLPTLAGVNTVFTVTYEVENRSIFPAYDVTLEPFLRIPELERESHKRYSFKAGEKRILRERFLLKKRGVYSFPRAGAETGFPFGLVRKSFLGEKQEKKDLLHIAPRPSPGKWSFMGMTPGEQRGNFLAAKKKKSRRNKRNSVSLEFAGLREYTPGDEIRHIHFPSSARKGELIMKQFQEEEKEHFLIIFDPFVPEGEFLADTLSFLLSPFSGGGFRSPAGERELLFEETLESLYGCITSVRETLAGSVDLLFTDGEGTRILRDAGDGRNYSFLLPEILAEMEKTSGKDRWRNWKDFLKEEEPSRAVYISAFASPEGECILAFLRKNLWDVTLEIPEKGEGEK